MTSFSKQAGFTGDDIYCSHCSRECTYIQEDQPTTEGGGNKALFDQDQDMVTIQKDNTKSAKASN